MRKRYVPPTFGDDGDVIHTHSREQAVNRGLLVDVTTIAEEAAGARLPVTLTAAVHARLQPSEQDHKLGATYEGRVREVLKSVQSRVADTVALTDDFDIAFGDADALHLSFFFGPKGHGLTIMFAAPPHGPTWSYVPGGEGGDPIPVYDVYDTRTQPNRQEMLLLPPDDAPST